MAADGPFLVRFLVLSVLLMPPGTAAALDADGFSELHLAAIGGHVGRVRELISAGADVDVRQPTKHGTPLQYAAMLGHGETVTALIANHATFNARDAEGQTPLLCAAAEGHADVVRRLLDAGANIDASADGWTALHYAVSRGHTQLAQLLIDRGANVYHQNSHGQTPIDLNPDMDLRVPWRWLERSGALSD
jgi:ankyrin repeat protein